jgi:predicted membrane channel-forming protein YqfA (hemolysin III family)
MKRKGSIGQKLLFFVLGMLAMMALDMIFHFNNSIETKLDRKLNQFERKLERTFK